MDDDTGRRGRRVDGVSDEESAPVDFELLETISKRFRTDERFRRVDRRPEYAPNSVVLRYDLGYFPSVVESTFLRVRWHENDDFQAHYEEQYDDGRRWACRWDRHPNEHNVREHYHPAPDAGKPAEDTSYPDDWRDVLAEILAEIDDHVEAFWSE